MFDSMNKVPKLFRKFCSVARHAGLRVAVDKAYRKLFPREAVMPYSFWIGKYDTVRESDVKEMQADIDGFLLKPLISVVMPVYNTEIDYLRQAIDSVRDQVYQKWELCIADDASSYEAVRKVLREYAEMDSRIKVCYRKKNGHISLSSNSALELVTGEFTALMDHDDVLPIQAFYMVAREINQTKGNVDLIYTDEDKLDENGRRYDPYFKMDWNPVMIYSQNFVAHLGVYRTAIIRKIGGFRSGFEGSQDYDFLLRFLRHTDASKIRHIPHVLYHWRIFTGNHTFSTDNHSISDGSAYKALTEYFSAEPGINIEAVPNFPGCWRIKRPLPEVLPLISVIIPTRDHVAVLKMCIDSIIAKTDYPRYEIIVVDNASKEEESKDYFRLLSKQNNIRVIPYAGAFNYSAINNVAVRQARGEYILFLNNDMKIISSGWMTELLRSLQNDRAGIAGGKLYYPIDTIQHAGFIIGIYGVASHGMRHRGRRDTGYFGQLFLERNVSAVTGACMMVSRTVFDAVGGFDEECLRVSYNDVDFCLKVRNAGWQVIFNPNAELYHFESVSRGEDETPEQKEINRYERHVMYERYGSQLQQDPFFSPELSLNNEDYELAPCPRVGKPWRDWVEFVCPFHRGDVLIGLQVAYTAYKRGVKLRFHISEKILPWVREFACPFPIEPIPIGIPTAGDTYAWYLKARDYVAEREDSSGHILGSHPQFNFSFLGLNIVENMLNEFQLPITVQLDNFVPEPKALSPEDAKLLQGKVLLLHPFGGWQLKSMPQFLHDKLVMFFHAKGYRVLQIGGSSDEKLSVCDGYILRNESIGYWRSVFQSGGMIAGVDSWTSHFAAILDLPQIIFYGPTNVRDVCSKHCFKSQRNPALIVNTVADCAPCNSFDCLEGKTFCRGFGMDENDMEAFLEEVCGQISRVK